MHHYVNRGTFGGASDRPKSRSSDGKQKGRFESSSQLLDQGTAIGERFLKAAVRLAEISIPVIALEKSFHARRLLLCRVSGYSIVQIARPIPDIEFNDLHSQ